MIEPYGLMLSWGYWYCVARARDCGAMRVFRLDRMRTAELLQDESAQFLVPPDFSVRNYLDRAPWELSEEPRSPLGFGSRFPTLAGPSPRDSVAW